MYKFYELSERDFSRKFPNLERDVKIFRDYYSIIPRISFKNLGKIYGISGIRVEQIIWRQARRLISKEEVMENIKNS